MGLGEAAVREKRNVGKRGLERPLFHNDARSGGV